MMLSRTRFFLWLMTLLLPVCLVLPALAQESAYQTLRFDDKNRTYTVHLPAGYDGETPVPLVIALHGFASSGKGIQALSGLDATADEHGFMVVYPDSFGFYWDDYRGVAKVPPAEYAVEDIGFLEALIESLADEYVIDPAQVHLVGHGNGGTMALRAACEMPERFASVVVVGALMWSYFADNCPESDTAVNLLVVHGTEDIFFPVEERRFEGSEQFILSRADSLAFWAARFGCETPETTGAVTTYSGCADNKTLALYSIEGSGNNWLHIDESRKLNQLGIELNEVLAAFFSGENWQKLAIEPAPNDILARSYILYVPPNYDPSKATPLVMMLHGRPQSSTSLAYMTDMNHVAAREGFIVVYPDGIDNQWSYGYGWELYPGLKVNDDLFIENLLDDLALDLNIDTNRTYLTGFSNGGFMTQRLACLMPERFAAFAPVGATAPIGIVPACEGAPAVPIQFIHGTEDPSVGWDGTVTTVQGRQIFVTAPISVTLGFWGNHNGCTHEFVLEELPKLGLTPEMVTRVFSFVCPETTPMKLYAVIGGGHVWHGIRPTDDAQLGKGTMDFNASEVVWKFFKQFSLDTREFLIATPQPEIQPTQMPDATAESDATQQMDATAEPDATQETEADN